MRNDRFTMDVGLALDLKNGLHRNGWQSAEEVKQLASGDTLQLVREVVLGRAEIKLIQPGDGPSLRFDKRNDGWTLLEHTPRRIVSASNLEAVSFLRSGEKSIQGYEMIGRARYELGIMYGQEDAEWLLENQASIPAELRQYYLVFTGTVWRSSGGDCFVPYLYWFGEQWILHWDWLVDDWFSCGQLVRPCK